MPLKTLALALSTTLFLTTGSLAGSAQLLRDGRPHSNAGNPAGAGALSLTDDSASWFEIGRSGQEVSVSCYHDREPCLPRFQVRNPDDTASSIWINGRNRIGSQHGPIVFAFGSSNEGGNEVGRFEADGNLVLVNDLIMENRSLKARLADIETRLSALESGSMSK
jgi:hypothetical protein